MSILVDTVGESLIIHLKGHIDANTATELEKEVFAVLESIKGPFILNMESVDYISSAGLRFFLIVSKWSMSHRVGFCLASVNDTVMHIFNISGFSRLMRFQPTLDEAVLSQKSA